MIVKDEESDANTHYDRLEIMYSSFGFDTVGFSKNDSQVQRKIKETLNKCIKDTINQIEISNIFLDYTSNLSQSKPDPKIRLEEIKKKLEENRENTGDGEYITIDIQNSSILLDFAIQFIQNLKKINRENSEENNGIPEIKIRTALHADVGYPIGRSIQGPVLNNLERILNMGSAGDILLSEYIVAIIKVTSKKHNSFLRYAGIYPKRKGGTEKIWYYYREHRDNDNEDEDKKQKRENHKIGNKKKPRKEKKSFIFYTTRKNKTIAISLIIFGIIGVIISSSLFINKPIVNNKIDELKSELQQELFNIYVEHTNKRKNIEKIFQDKYSNNTILLTTNNPPTIYQIFDNDIDIKQSINAILQDHISQKGSKSIYNWIAEPNSCIIKAYKPYDFNFNNISGLHKSWCKGIKNYDSYLSSAVFASGPKDFVNVLVSKLKINKTDGSSVNIGYYGEAINWNSIIPPLIKYSENNLLLIDKEGYLAADCIDIGCRKLTENTNDNTFSNDTESIKYQNKLFFDKFYTAIADNYYLNSFPPNTHLLNNWKLVIIEPGIINNYLYNIFLLIISIVMLSIILYAYLIPRDWLDDYDEKTVKIK